MDRSHIIVVEDDSSANSSIRCLLEAFNFDVTTFSSGEELLQSGTDSSAGCFLIDMQLPGMSGIQLIESLRLRNDQTPVITVSGYIDTATRAEAERFGVFAVLEKPVRPLELIAQIRIAIDGVNDQVA